MKGEKSIENICSSPYILAPYGFGIVEVTAGYEEKEEIKLSFGEASGDNDYRSIHVFDLSGKKPAYKGSRLLGFGGDSTYGFVPNGKFRQNLSLFRQKPW